MQPEPSDPPVAVKVVVCPAQIVVVPEIPVGAVGSVFTVTVTGTRVELHVDPADTVE